MMQKEDPCSNAGSVMNGATLPGIARMVKVQEGDCVSGVDQVIMKITNALRKRVSTC